VRGSAQVHDEEFKACVALQAQYVLDTFGMVPGTVPTVFIMNHVQAHHLDLDFYDRPLQARRLPAHPGRAHAALPRSLRWPRPPGNSAPHALTVVRAAGKEVARRGDE
jgi:hypothetical protein